MKTPLQPWVDGVVRNAAHPRTFHIPAAEERVALKVGDHAKVATESDDRAEVPGEKFWVQVVEVVDGPRYRVRVDNELVYTLFHGLAFNDIVEIEPRHVLGTVVPHPLANPNLRFFQ